MNFKANTISEIVPRNIFDSNPGLQHFLEAYYEWERKATVTLSTVFGNLDTADKSVSFETFLVRDIELIVESQKRYLLEFETDTTNTYIPSEILTFYVEKSVGIDVTQRDDGVFLFNGIEAPSDFTFYRGQTYRLNVNTNTPFYLKTVQSGGGTNLISVTNNGTTNGVIDFTILNNIPDPIFYASSAGSQTGIIKIRDIPDIGNQIFTFDQFDDISILGFGYIENVLLHTEYVVENFDNILSVRSPNRVYNRFLENFGFERLFENNFVNRAGVQDFNRFLTRKGTEDSIKFFFRNFFGRNVSITNPALEVIRASDATWFQRNIVFVEVQTTQAKGIEFERNRLVVGKVSGATFIIEAFAVNNARGVYKLFFDERKSTGTLLIGEKLLVVDDEDSAVLFDQDATVVGTVRGTQIVEPGQEYTIADEIATTFFTAQGEFDLLLRVDDIIGGPIDDLEIVASGSGYSVGDEVIFPQLQERTNFFYTIDENPAGDSIYTGFTTYVDFDPFIDDYSPSYIGATTVFDTVQYTVAAYTPATKELQFVNNGVPAVFVAGQRKPLTFDSTNVIDPYVDVNAFHPSSSVTKSPARGFVSQVNDVTGAIEDISLVFRGRGYIRNLTPSDITVQSETGSGAEIVASGVNLGGLAGVTVLNDVIGLQNDTVVNIPQNVDTTKNAEVRLNFGPFTTFGNFFTNNFGFISDNQYIHDSFFYQDYSYVIESDLNISEFGELFTELAHPAGLVFFNRFVLINFFNFAINGGVDTVNSQKTLLIEVPLVNMFGLNIENVTQIMDESEIIDFIRTYILTDKEFKLKGLFYPLFNSIDEFVSLFDPFSSGNPLTIDDVGGDVIDVSFELNRDSEDTYHNFTTIFTIT
jgi:hypothetical protein